MKKLFRKEYLPIYYLLTISISLIVVGAINIKDVFPEELFYTPDGYYTGKHLVSRFVILSAFMFPPREASFESAVTYFNVFPLQLIMYGSLLIAFILLYLFIGKNNRFPLVMMMLVSVALVIYLLSICITSSIFQSTDNSLYIFDYIYSLIILAMLIGAISLLIITYKKNYSFNIRLALNKLIGLIISSLIGQGLLIFAWVEASFLVFLGSSWGHGDVSKFEKVLQSFGNRVWAQKLFVTPSILYSLTIVLNVFTLVYLILLIIQKVKKKNRTLNEDNNDIIKVVVNMKKISTVMYLGIIAFFLLGLFFCFYYAPSIFGLYSGTYGIWERVELIFYWLCSIPCFILLCLALKLTSLVKKGDFFSLSSVKLLSIGGYLLAADSITFIVVNIVFAILRKSFNTEVLMTLFSLVGLAIGVSMILISKAVEQSKQYKDSGEGVI